MNNVVYAKFFDNGKIYVGMTNNFERRMYEHEYASKLKGIKPLVSRAMRKHSHYTEILARFEDRQDCLDYEVRIIENFKQLGFELYNLTDGGEGVIGIDRSYSHKKVLKHDLWGNFICEYESIKLACEDLNVKHNTVSNHLNETGSITCKRKYLLCFEGDDIQIKVDRYLNSERNVIPKKRVTPKVKPMKYYEINPTRIDAFKSVCENRGLDYKTFNKTESFRKGNKIYYLFNAN